MTFSLTPERLQDIAVSCVVKFMDKQASLSEAIAKEAQELELNSEQTKRVIEATNTIAYLRQLEKAADRTFEFDVADYSKVMANMCIPEDMHKQASTSYMEAPKDTAETVSNAVASGGDMSQYVNTERVDREKRASLMKGFMKSKHELTKLAYDMAEMQLELSSAISEIRKDPLALEKLAQVSETSTIDATASMCSLEKRAYADNLVFTTKELATAQKVSFLYKQACDMLVKRDALETFVKRAEAVLFPETANVEKLAGFLESGIRGVGRMFGSAVGGTIKAVGSTAVNGAKNIGAFSGAASSKGFSSTAEGVKAYNSMAGKKGVAAATAAFKGTKPSMLNRVGGIAGVGTALGAVLGASSLSHKNNVKDL